MRATTGIGVVLLLIWTLTACQSSAENTPESELDPGAFSTQIAEPTLPPPTPLVTVEPVEATLAPEEVFEFSGERWDTSESFHLEEDGTIEITWEYSGEGLFAIWVVNISEEITDPDFDRILVTESNEATTGSAEIALISGDYWLEVEIANGPWVVSFRKLS